MAKLKANNPTHATLKANAGGGAGTNDYNDLSNKPQINGIALVGNKTTEDLGIESYDDTEIRGELSDEATARQNADNNLQGQIDAITVSSDVVDIVGTYQELQNYDTSILTDDDIIKVLVDSTHSNAMSYYRWTVTNDVGAWVYVGSEGPFYTKSESDTKYQEKLVSGTNIKTINNQSILGSGNIDTSNVKFVTPTSFNVSMNPFNITMTLSSTDCADILAKKYDFVTLLVENQLGINITCAKQADSSVVCGYFCQVDTGSDVYYYSWACVDSAVFDNVTKKIDTPINVSAFNNDAGYITSSYHDSSKQDTLVSGTNIKTINNTSILGSGDLHIDPAGGANLEPLEVPNDTMILYDFIMDAEYPETYTISNDNDVLISIEKEAGTNEIWVQKGSIISVYPQYSATILSADGMYMYYVDWESGEYLTGGGAVDYDTVVQIVDDTVDTSNLVDLTSDQTITGKKTFKDSGIEFSKTGYTPKTGFEAATNGLSLTYTDNQGNKTTKLGVGSQYTTTDQDLIPRNDYSYNAMTGEYTGTNLGKNDKKYNVLYARALSEDGQVIKPVVNLLSNDKNLLPDSGFARNIGSSSLKWNYLYLGGNLEMSVGDINQVRAITANEYRVKDGNYNNNYYSLLKYAYVSPGKTVAQLQNGIDVNNRVIHNIGTPDDDTSPISKGYADSHYQGTLTAGTGIAITNNVISSTLEGIDYEVDQQLPQTGEKGIIYLIPNGSSEQENIYDEYIWIPALQEGESGRFEFIGTTQTDLTNYVDLSSAQTITGKKTFSGNINVANEINFNSSGTIKRAGSSIMTFDNSAILFYQPPRASTDGGQSIGTSTRRWNHLYLKGTLRDGNNANYGLAIPDTTAYTANKTIATTDDITTAVGDIDTALQNLVSGNGVV